MEDIVFPSPEMRAPADEVETHRHGAIEPAVIRIRFVIRVVHDVEADRYDHESQPDGERDHLPPDRNDEHQQSVGQREGR
jgi:hypothetical protein